MHHEDGFALYTCGSNSVIGNNTGSAPPGRLLWSQPFQKLRMSSDDGARLLWLKFDGENTDLVSFYLFKLTPLLMRTSFCKKVNEPFCLENALNFMHEFL